MFMGHYSAALFAKAIEPRVPLWGYAVAAELLDIAWSAAVIAGVESFRFDTTLAGPPLDLYHMPWTHSLPAAFGWALLGTVAARHLLRLPATAAMFIGLAIFLHWPLDLIVHRPDLALGFGGPKLGFALWDTPVLAQVIEMGLLLLAASAWCWRRGFDNLRLLPALGFATLLLAMQALSVIAPAQPTPVGFGFAGLAIYGGIAAAAWLAERNDKHPGETRKRTR